MVWRVVLGRRLPEAGMALFAARPDVEVVQLADPGVAEWHAEIGRAHV